MKKNRNFLEMFRLKKQLNFSTHKTVFIRVTPTYSFAPVGGLLRNVRLAASGS